MPLFTLPTELKLISTSLRDRCLFDVYHQPVAYAQIEDESANLVTLVTCSDFNISYDRDAIMASFSVTIQKAQLWNPRTSAYANLLEIDKRKRVHIYFGQVINGTAQYVKIFTGIVTEKPESYSYGGTDFITLKGSNLAYLLFRQNGTYSVETYSGYSKGLIEYWCTQAGLSYNLSYTDPILFSATTIAYKDALSGLVDLKKILGPNVEAFIGANDILTIRDKLVAGAGTVEFVYDESNLISLSRTTQSSKIITEVQIDGSTDLVTANTLASAAIIERYGKNRYALSSGLITVDSYAETLAQSYLDWGLSFQNSIQASMLLNPYLQIGSVISVKDDCLSSTDLCYMRIDQLSHTYTAGSMFETRIEGYYE